MPFTTDAGWTPAMYRRALCAWNDNAPKYDSGVLPRDAKTDRPRHAKLSKKLRSLLTWRAVMDPGSALSTSWLRLDAANDNEAFPADVLLDTETEIRPSIGELRTQWHSNDPDKNVEYRDVRGIGLVAVGGNMDHGSAHGPTFATSETNGPRAPRRNYRVVQQIGELEFSNGEQVERAPVLREDRVVMADIRMPVGALVRHKGGRRPSERFRGAKGSLPTAVPTVGVSATASPGTPSFHDPVVDAEFAATLRAEAGEQIAAILDLALRAANFSDIGEALGKSGKHAERAGKRALIDACSRLEEILRAA